MGRGYTGGDDGWGVAVSRSYLLGCTGVLVIEMSEVYFTILNDLLLEEVYDSAIGAR